jgi:tetratricopeptide (TPR) repeat protein
MSDASVSVAHVGDLLTFPSSPRDTDGSSGPVAGSRLGLRRATSAAAWFELGIQLEARASLDGRGETRAAAQAAYERAVAGCPTFADAYCNLGRMHADAGELALAETWFRLAICCEPSVALYWFNLGVSVEDQGRYAEAIAAYEHAIELDSEAADANHNLARLLELVGRRSGDVEVMRRAVRHLLRYRQLTRSKAGVR